MQPDPRDRPPSAEPIPSASRRAIPLYPALSLLICCSSFGSGGGCDRSWVGNFGDIPPPPPDVTAPTTRLLPDSGLLDASRTATLQADEFAMVYFTVDGSSPEIDAPGTLSRASPAEVTVPTDTAMVRYFSVDLSGNREVERTTGVRVDAALPSATFTNVPKSPLDLLDTGRVRFMNTEPCEFTLEFGGDGTRGTGLLFAQGFVDAVMTLSYDVIGIGVPLSTNQLWLHMTDSAGNAGAVSTGLASRSPTEVPLFVPIRDLALRPDGARAYLATPSGIVVVDTEQNSPTRHSVLTTIPLGAEAKHLAVGPRGLLLYASTDVGIAIVELRSATQISILPTGAGPAFGIAITPDGSRAYYCTSLGSIRAMSVDLASSEFGLSEAIATFSEPIDDARVAISKNGKMAFVSSHDPFDDGIDRVRVRVFDSDAGSETFHEELSGPEGLVTRIGIGLRTPQLAFSPDGSSAFLPIGTLRRVDLTSAGFETLDENDAITPSAVAAAGDGWLLALAQDGRRLSAVTEDPLAERGFRDFTFEAAQVIDVSADQGSAYSVKPRDDGDTLLAWPLR